MQLYVSDNVTAIERCEIFQKSIEKLFKINQIGKLTKFYGFPISKAEFIFDTARLMHKSHEYSEIAHEVDKIAEWTLILLKL